MILTLMLGPHPFTRRIVWHIKPNFWGQCALNWCNYISNIHNFGGRLTLKMVPCILKVNLYYFMKGATLVTIMSFATSPTF